MLNTNTTKAGERTQLVDGATYELGSSSGVYRANGDYFSGGNYSVPRSDTIYGDNADPLYLRDLRESEILRNATTLPGTEAA